MKTILFWTAYSSVALAAGWLISTTRIGGWQAWLAYLGSDSVVYTALRLAIEPRWLRLEHKSGWFIIR